MPFKETDFAPIIWLSSVPQIVVVHPSLPVKNVKELIALEKSRPGQLSYGSSGNGAINHLAGELFNHLTGTKLVHVPYKGGVRRRSRSSAARSASYSASRRRYCRTSTRRKCAPSP